MKQLIDSESTEIVTSQMTITKDLKNQSYITPHVLNRKYYLEWQVSFNDYEER